MNEELKVVNKKKFVEDIENIVCKDKIGYFDAIMEYAERNEIENALIVDLIKGCKPIRVKLQAECEDLNLLKVKKGRKLI